MPKRAAMWKHDESGRVHTPFEPLVLAATLALIPVLIIEADTESEGWLPFTGRSGGARQGHSIQNRPTNRITDVRGATLFVLVMLATAYLV